MYLHGFENIWKIKTRQGEWTLSIPNLKDLKSENEVLNSSHWGQLCSYLLSIDVFGRIRRGSCHKRCTLVVSKTSEIFLKSQDKWTYPSVGNYAVPPHTYTHIHSPTPQPYQLSYTLQIIYGKITPKSTKLADFVEKLATSDEASSLVIATLASIDLQNVNVS